MRLTPLLLLVPALAACGGAQGAADNAGDFKGEEKAVAQVVDDLAEYARDDDADRICKSVLARPVRDRLNDCQEVVADQLGDADAYDLDVEDVDLRGATATATVTATEGGDERRRTLRFVREGPAWRLNALR